MKRIKNEIFVIEQPSKKLIAFCERLHTRKMEQAERLKSMKSCPIEVKVS